TLLALGRLYRDSEMTALTACGFGPRAVYRPLLLLALPLALISGGLSLYVVPKAMELRNELRDQARREAEVSLFSPGTFRELAGGDYVVYAQTLEEQGRRMGGVFIQNPLDKGRIAVTTGARGHLEVDPDNGARYMVLDDGYRFEGRPGGGDYQSVRFQRLKVRMDTPTAEQGQLRREAMSSWGLWQRGLSVDLAELHARLGGPVSLLLIAFLAPLLARTGPREGRYGRLVAGVLIYAVYLNLLGVGQAWLEHGVVPAVVGLWWVHGLLGAVVVGLWWYQNHAFRPRRTAL
ncbi:MAG: LPS export ABC transporter permease LptF, partial [Candidatus Competibacteraceae bacterium]|nr:LPS export ABC transporter permease LptF [Candidatus Competibacteraceae bacterium]